MRPIKAQAAQTQSVRDQLLEHTLVLIGRRGFNGFSYRDLAELVGVKTSSIHYYFPTKDDLVREAVSAYRARIAARLQAIDTALPLEEQVAQFLAPWRRHAVDDLVCVAAMLSSEALSLPEPVHGELKAFHQMYETWLGGLLARAETELGKALPVPAIQLAQLIYGGLQNALITARLFAAPPRIDAPADVLMAIVLPAHAGKPGPQAIGDTARSALFAA